MIKVLFLSAWYPNRYDSMAGLFVQKHAEAVSLFCDVALIYVHSDEQISKQEIHVTSEKGFLEIRIYYPSFGQSSINKFLKQYYYFKAYKHGFKLLFKTWGKPEIIQANVFTRTAIIALIIKFIYDIPYLVIEHWTRYFREKTFRNILHKKITIYTAKKASVIMPVTNHLKNCMVNHGMKNSNFITINNVVENIFFNEIAKPDSDKIRILNVTCFDDAQKNLSGILNVIYVLSKHREDFEVYLVGDGVDFEYIKSLSITLNLYNRFVFFTGIKTGKELVEIYQKSNFTVLFSNYENIPVVISESLVCGKPVLSSNVGGICEHINITNGILIDAGDENALLEKMNYLLDHFEDYDLNRIKTEAKEKYSYESLGKKLNEIYKDIKNNEVRYNN